MTTAQRDIVSYGVIIVFCAAMLAWGIPTYSPEYPGYGMPASTVPSIAVGLMLLLSLTGLVRTLSTFRRERQDKKEERRVVIHWLYLVCFLLPCFLLMPAMHLAGFVPAGMLFMLIIQLFCGQRRIAPLVLVTALPVLIVYVLMRYGLGVPMP